MMVKACVLGCVVAAFVAVVPMARAEGFGNCDHHPQR